MLQFPFIIIKGSFLKFFMKHNILTAGLVCRNIFTYISFSLSARFGVCCMLCVCFVCWKGSGCFTSYLNRYTIPGHILKSLDIGASLETVLLSHSPGTTCQWLHKMEGQAGSQGLWKKINKPVIIDVKLSIQVCSSRQIKARL